MKGLMTAKNIIIACGVLIVLPLTHIMYGFSFMKGLMTAKKI
jgi:hypothetical protein